LPPSKLTKKQELLSSKPLQNLPNALRILRLFNQPVSTNILKSWLT
jgi:hypothetical protein